MFIDMFIDCTHHAWTVSIITLAYMYYTCIISHHRQIKHINCLCYHLLANVTTLPYML